LGRRGRGMGLSFDGLSQGGTFRTESWTENGTRSADLRGAGNAAFVMAGLVPAIHAFLAK
jgi:hypothetical protein